MCVCVSVCVCVCVCVSECECVCVCVCECGECVLVTVVLPYVCTQMPIKSLVCSASIAYWITAGKFEIIDSHA